jgi:hypothetical protein
VIARLEKMSNAYILMRWVNRPEGEPVETYVEFDSERYEVRKVERFPDGSLDRADSQHETERTMLGERPLPTTEDIESLGLAVEDIDRGDFERVWTDASDSMT